MPSNTRQHPREEVTLRVDYMDAQGRGGLGLAKNLSYTGIALTSLSRPPAGRRHAGPDVRHVARERL